jgi:hypothetical protein
MRNVSAYAKGEQAMTDTIKISRDELQRIAQGQQAFEAWTSSVKAIMHLHASKKF